MPFQRPQPRGAKVDVPSYLKQVDAIYVTDAYHSLSMEGYRVSTELIERVRAGTWKPDSIKADRDQRNAMAATRLLASLSSARQAKHRKGADRPEPGHRSGQRSQRLVLSQNHARPNIHWLVSGDGFPLIGTRREKAALSNLITSLSSLSAKQLSAVEAVIGAFAQETPRRPRRNRRSK